MQKPELHALTATFTQEGNTNGTTQEYEELEIRLETPDTELEAPDGFYIVLKSGKGWSVDSIDELSKMVAWLAGMLTKRVKEISQ